MSKTAAKISMGLIELVTAPLNDRQRGKARAHLVHQLGGGTYDVVETDRGPLKLYGGRGSTIASTVANWDKDEPETRHWIKEFVKPGDVLWDIGANVGIFSIYAAMCEGVKVFAFEPSAMNLGLLVEHIALNGMQEKIDVYPAAFADHDGVETLYIKSEQQGAACNSVGEARHQFGAFEPHYKHHTMVYKMDSFAKMFDVPYPDHVKLDVDGIEKDIIAGGPAVLKKAKSLIVDLEGRNENNSDIEKMISDAGLEYDPALEGMGTGRNKLYVRKK